MRQSHAVCYILLDFVPSSNWFSAWNFICLSGFPCSVTSSLSPPWSGRVCLFWKPTVSCLFLVLSRSQCVLVHLGCCNRRPQTGWFKQHFISHRSGGWESEVRVPVRLVPHGGTFLVDRGQPPCCILMTGRETGLWSLHPLIKTPVLLWGLHPHDISETRVPPKTISWGLGLQQMRLGETQTFSHRGSGGLCLSIDSYGIPALGTQHLGTRCWYCKFLFWDVTFMSLKRTK